MKRNISGIFFRIKRNDKFESVVFEELTEKEQDELLSSMDEKFMKGLIKKLAKTITEIAEQCDLIMKYE